MPTQQPNQTGFRPGPLAMLVSATLALAAPAAAQVAGDEACNAIWIEEGETLSVNTATMTASANAPSPLAGTCDFLNWPTTNKDVWFRFLPYEDGTLSVFLCDSNFDTSLVLYASSLGECITPLRVACNDDACQPGGPTYQSKLEDEPVRRRQVIFIRVGGFNGATGNAVVRVSFKPTRGEPRCWGSNSGGQSSVPSFLTGAFSGIDGGLSHSVALRPDGTLACWGSNAAGQATAPYSQPWVDRFVAVAAGDNHNFAIREQSPLQPIIVAWGDNTFGQASVPTFTPTGSIAPVAIASGEGHGLALVTGLTPVRAWGRNTEGQATVPATLSNVEAIAAGGRHSLALRVTGAIEAWGDNSEGQRTVPTGLAACTAIAGGGRHSVALLQNRTVRAWGRNVEGQCSVPSNLGQCARVDAGGNFTIALLRDGSIRCWGSSASGESTVPTGLKPGVAATGGTAHSAVLIGPDCDGNGTNDYLELDGHDCNFNDIHDCVDIAAGLVEDCNGNGLCDNQEKMGLVQVGSGNLSPIGYPLVRNWTISNVSRAAGTVWIKAFGKGDFSSYLEYVTIRCGSRSWRVFEASGTMNDCVEISNLTSTGAPSIVLQPDEFNALIGPDGRLSIDIEPSIAVDAGACGGSSRIRLELSYNNALSPDCNANGLLDSCELADGFSPDANGNGVIDTCEAPFGTCPADLDGDGFVNGADLGAMLGAWGPVPPTASADLNGDGQVNGADLGALLGEWGSCE